jgi:hypothetical protein
MDPFGGQDFGDARSDAFDILNRGGKFEHAQNGGKLALSAPGRLLQQEMVAGANCIRSLRP